MYDADGVNSVTFVGRRVALSEEDVAKMASAVAARRLSVKAIPAHSDVAVITGVETILVSVPTAVWKF